MADAILDNDFSKTNIDPRILVRKVNELVLKPKAVYVNKFTEESALKFHKDMAEAEDTGQKIIPIYIDSYGGYVDSLVHMVDVIKSCKISVATICIGKAMSCGAVLLTQGADKHRYIAGHSRVMIHDVASFTSGKVEEIKSDAAETDRLNDLIYTWMAEGTGHDTDYFKKIVHDKSHADWFLTAEEAKKHNIINHIRVPKFTINVDVDIKFG
jgi:ATP-dependent Clp protease protease subunit